MTLWLLSIYLDSFKIVFMFLSIKRFLLWSPFLILFVILIMSLNMKLWNTIYSYGDFRLWIFWMPSSTASLLNPVRLIKASLKYLSSILLDLPMNIIKSLVNIYFYIHMMLNLHDQNPEADLSSDLTLSSMGGDWFVTSDTFKIN